MVNVHQTYWTCVEQCTPNLLDMCLLDNLLDMCWTMYTQPYHAVVCVSWILSWLDRINTTGGSPSDPTALLVPLKKVLCISEILVSFKTNRYTCSYGWGFGSTDRDGQPRVSRGGCPQTCTLVYIRINTTGVQTVAQPFVRFSLLKTRFRTFLHQTDHERGLVGTSCHCLTPGSGDFLPCHNKR